MIKLIGGKSTYVLSGDPTSSSPYVHVSPDIGSTLLQRAVGDENRPGESVSPSALNEGDKVLIVAGRLLDDVFVVHFED